MLASNLLTEYGLSNASQNTLFQTDYLDDTKTIDADDGPLIIDEAPIALQDAVDFTSGFILVFYATVVDYARNGDCYSQLFMTSSSIIENIKLVQQPLPEKDDYGGMIGVFIDVLFFVLNVRSTTKTCINQYDTAQAEDWLSNYQRTLTQPNWVSELKRFSPLISTIEPAIKAYSSIAGDKEVAAFIKGTYVAEVLGITLVWAVEYFGLDDIIYPMDPWNRYLYFTQ